MEYLELYQFVTSITALGTGRAYPHPISLVLEGAYVRVETLDLDVDALPRSDFGITHWETGRKTCHAYCDGLLHVFDFSRHVNLPWSFVETSAADSLLRVEKVTPHGSMK
jgi:hypothetical protein